MTARIVTTYFPDERGKTGYDRMLMAFAASVRSNSSLPLEVIRPKCLPKGKSSRHKIDMNTHKLEAMAEYAMRTDGDILFLDCDMLVLSDPAEVFDVDFDAAYTVADYPRYPPFNGGFLAFRGYHGRVELYALQEMNAKLHRDPELHEKYRAKYQGINQSAMGALFENGHVWQKFPMSTWNLCEPWPKEFSFPKILHCKAKLMRSCLAGEESARWVKTWQGYEKTALGIGAKKLLGFSV